MVFLKPLKTSEPCSKTADIHDREQAKSRVLKSQTALKRLRLTEKRFSESLHPNSARFLANFGFCLWDEHEKCVSQSTEANVTCGKHPAADTHSHSHSVLFVKLSKCCSRSKVVYYPNVFIYIVYCTSECTQQRVCTALILDSRAECVFKNTSDVPNLSYCLLQEVDILAHAQQMP